MKRYLITGLILLILSPALSGCYPIMKYQWEQTVEGIKDSIARRDRDVAAEAAKERWDKEAIDAKEKTLSQERANDSTKHKE